MGCYVNPKLESKESWLKREGNKVSQVSWDNLPEGTLPVVVMNNRFFTAAGVAYSEDELKAFTDPSDHRHKEFYYVDVEKLAKVSDIKDYI